MIMVEYTYLFGDYGNAMHACTELLVRVKQLNLQSS